jgi:hypothetical protein
MTNQQKIIEITSLMAFLQKYIQVHVDQSFTDLTFDLESLVKDYLNVFEDATQKYKNVNGIKHNYPAIDLVNSSKGIAIQVTTNADAKKVQKTIDTFERHKLAFSELIVIGFIKATKTKFPKATVFDISYLVSLTKHASSSQLDDLYNIVKRRIPWNTLSPMDDKHCFDVVFDVLNRSAVRDYTECEGNFDRMAEGLFEVKEIITTGRINGKPIRAKALVEYSGVTKRKLGEIEFHISQILQICNANKNQRKSEFLCLNQKEMDEIDELKAKIIDNTNVLARDFNIGKQIHGSRRR